MFVIFYRSKLNLFSIKPDCNGLNVTFNLIGPPYAHTVEESTVEYYIIVYFKLICHSFDILQMCNYGNANLCVSLQVWCFLK